MEDIGEIRPRGTAQGDQDRKELLSTKPLHRFVQRDPKTLGIVFLVFGCSEILMGCVLTADGLEITSCFLYIPYWQGALFLVCGILSIYSGIHPSKKMVTVCLAMYLVSFFGILFSVGSRITFLIFLDMSRYSRWYSQIKLSNDRGSMLISIEASLFVCSLCAAVMLIFLTCVSRRALKSTRTQVIVHQIPAPAPETPAE